MRDKLLNLLNDRDFISGERLAEKLEVSRTAVWKQIKSLQKLGYEIESIKNKGYRLISRPDIPIAEEVTQGLNTKIIGKDYFYFKSIDSTNSFAKKIIKNKVSEGAVIIADVQTQGRGRKNRTWSSPYGGLWFSVVLYPHLPPHRGMIITMMSSIAVAEGIQEITDLSPIIKRSLGPPNWYSLNIIAAASEFVFALILFDVVLSFKAHSSVFIK